LERTTPVLDFVALGVFVTVIICFVYLIIFIHDIPYEKAKERGHPQQDAIHVAGWISLFTLHVIWPFLWIWAFLYKPDEGWGFETVAIKDSPEKEDEMKALKERLSALEEKLSIKSKNLDNHKEEVK